MADPNTPGIVPIRSVELREINDRLIKIRQRLDRLDGVQVASPVSAAQLGALQASLNRLQRQVDDLEASMDQTIAAPPVVAPVSRTFAFFAG